MRIATYNVEWFNSLFDAQGALLEDGEWSGRRDVTRADQLTALGIVFSAMDADAIMVVEAPDVKAHRARTYPLENFAKKYGLRTRRALTGYSSDTQQEIALLYDPDVVQAVHDPQGPQTGKKGAHGAPRFDSAFRWDLDVDAASEIITFSKPPLEVALTTPSGNIVRLIGVHIKSKAPHGARGRAEVIRISIQNRRKQLAQSIWLRNRVEQHLKNQDPLIVLGDFNDGPGLDEYEKLFGRSAVEVVLGENGDYCLFDPHARMALSRRVGAMPITARFYIAHQKRYLQALLDYVMVSQDLRAQNPRWRIWHPFDDPACFDNIDLREALLTGSDHFPVTLDIDI